MKNEVQNDIILRSSVRRYKPDPVPREILEKVLDAARMAPSWKNDQPARYIIVDDSELLKKLTEVEVVTNSNSWLRNAPCMIVGTADPSKSGIREGLEYFMVDFGASMETLMISATSFGLGTCWIGIFEEERVKSILSIPEELRVVALAPIGYPDYPKSLTVDEAYEKKISRRIPTEEFVRFNGWKND